VLLYYRNYLSIIFYCCYNYIYILYSCLLFGPLKHRQYKQTTDNHITNNTLTFNAVDNYYPRLTYPQYPVRILSPPPVNLMSFSDIGTGNAPSTLRPAQRSSIASAVNTPGSFTSGGANGDADDLANSLRAFQTELTFLNNRITEMKRRLNSSTEKTEYVYILFYISFTPKDTNPNSKHLES
jgi:hypothetical protein